MYAFRDRDARERGLDLICEGIPPIDSVDPGLPPAARAAARKSGARAKVCGRWIDTYGFRGVIAVIRRAAELARLLADAGHIVVTAFISPYSDDRARARYMIG